MKKYFKLLFCLIFINSYAQELTIPTFTQYLGENDAVISPAYIGIGDNIKIRLNGLTQWVGIKNAPDNASLSVSGRLGQRSGLGLFVYDDKNGYTSQKGAKISFAHHLILDYYNDQYLSFGMSYIMNKFDIDITKFDPIFDPTVRNNREVINYNFDLGVLYRFKNLDLAGNVNNLLNKNSDVFGIQEPLKLRNYSVYSSMLFKSQRNSDIEFEPSVFYQYFESDSRSLTDINFKVRSRDFEDYYWAGITYRFLIDQPMKPLNIGPMVGFKKNNFYFAYSYQMTNNDFFKYNSGSHMVTLGYDIMQNISNCPCTQKYTKD